MKRSSINERAALSATTEFSVEGRVEKARVGVPVHEGVYLKLRVVERVRGRTGQLEHVAVDYLSRLGVETHLDNCKALY